MAAQGYPMPIDKYRYPRNNVKAHSKVVYGDANAIFNISSIWPQRGFWWNSDTHYIDRAIHKSLRLISDDRSCFHGYEHKFPFPYRLREQFSIAWAMGADLDWRPFLNLLLIFTYPGF